MPEASCGGLGSVGQGTNNMLKNILASITVAAGVAMAAAAPAAAGDSNGNIQIKLGGTFVDFDNKTKSLFTDATGGLNLVDALNATGKVENTVLPTATITYYLNKNIAVELFCCAGGSSIVGEGFLAPNGEIAHYHAFPPVLTLQYHLDGFGPIKPYAGVGVEWIHFWTKNGSNGLANTGSVKIDDFFGFALQGGLDYDLGGGWSLGVDVKKVWGNDVKVTWDNTAFGRAEAKHQIDPLFITANLGYRFNLSDLLGGRAAPAPLK